VTALVSRTITGAQQTVTITLTNTSATNIAFFVRLEVTAGHDGNEIVPIDNTDNYVSL
jgi:exo-1,4-beta-D-glucosaminidase